MIKLTEKEVKLAEQLLITVMRKEPYVEYKELGARVYPPIYQRNVSDHIGEISKLCYELGLPFISAKVVTMGKNEAGMGFYNLYIEYFPKAKSLTPREVFKQECKKIRECTEWYKLADHLHIDIDLPRPHVKLAIRILPMSSKDEFPEHSIEDVQNNYFLEELIQNKGTYKFRSSGINAPKGSLILFQFDNMIIASAVILDVEKYDVAVDDQYYGAYKFDVDTIKVFQPITLSEINQIDSNIIRFSQVKQEIKNEFWDEIVSLIEKKQTEIIADEIPKHHFESLIEGAKKQIVVNAYERNSKARQICIEHYGSICVVCGFDFAQFYGDEFEGKILVHHLKALSDIDDEYEVDPINDLRPVCPNCHLALHSKAGGKVYSIDELKAKIKAIV